MEDQMVILFADDQLRADSLSLERLVQRYGEQKAKRIRQRLDELQAAHDLAEFSTLPATGCKLVDGSPELVSAYTFPPDQILLKPAHNPIPYDVTGQLDWQQVTKVKVVSLNSNSHDGIA